MSNECKVFWITNLSSFALWQFVVGRSKSIVVYRLHWSITLCRGIDLELGKVDEDLLHIGPHQSEILDTLLRDESSQFGEGVTQQYVTARNIDAFNTVPYFGRGLLNADNSHGWLRLGAVWVVNLRNCAVVDELSRGNLLCDVPSHISLRVVKHLSLLNNLDRVTLTILRLQVVGRAEHNEAPIDHDSDLVTKLFRLVHPVGCQQHRSHVHLLDHSIQ